MHSTISQLKNMRLYIIQIIEGLSIEQLNQIPTGFSNNIIWNVAHLLASQQRICYMRSGIPSYVDDALLDAYKINTKPDAQVSEERIATIKKLFIDSIDQLNADYSQQLFENYTAWTNPYNITISNIEDAIAFLPFHEGLHTGTILALKKLV
jgi:DinB superfamily